MSKRKRRHKRRVTKKKSRVKSSPATYFEALENRMMFTTLTGGDVFEFIDANHQTIRVVINGTPAETQVELIGATEGPNGTIRLGPLAGDITSGGQAGKIIEELGDISVDTFPHVSTGSTDINIQALASRDNGGTNETYGFNVADDGVPNRLIQLVVFDETDPSTVTLVADLHTNVATFPAGEVTRITAADFDPTDPSILYFVASSVAGGAVGDEGIDRLYAVDVDAGSMVAVEASALLVPGQFNDSVADPLTVSSIAFDRGHGGLFDGSDVAVVDVATDQVILGPDHGLVTGDAVVYRAGVGGTDVGGLTSDQTYFVVVIDPDAGIVQVATTFADATLPVPVVIDLTGTGTGTNHSLSDTNLYAIMNEGSGATATSGLALVDLVDTDNTTTPISIVDSDGNPISAISGIEFTDAAPTTGDPTLGDPVDADEEFFAITNAAESSKIYKVTTNLAVPFTDSAPAATLIGWLPDPEDFGSSTSPQRGRDLQGLAWHPNRINPFVVDQPLGVLLATDGTSDELVAIDTREINLPKRILGGKVGKTIQVLEDIGIDGDGIGISTPHAGAGRDSITLQGIASRDNGGANETYGFNVVDETLADDTVVRHIQLVVFDDANASRFRVVANLHENTGVFPLNDDMDPLTVDQPTVTTITAADFDPNNSRILYFVASSEAGGAVGDDGIDRLYRVNVDAGSATAIANSAQVLPGTFGETMDDPLVVTSLSFDDGAPSASGASALVIDGSDGVGAVDVVADELTLNAAHGLATGDAVVYDNGSGTDILGLTNGQTYFVVVVDPVTVQLTATYDDATQGPPVLVDLIDVGTGATHSISGTIGAQFDGSNGVVTDLATDRLTLGAGHGLVTGSEVVYRVGAGGSAIGGLADNQTYFAVVIDAAAGIVQLAITFNNAIQATPVVIDLTSLGTGTAHTLNGTTVNNATPTGGQLDGADGLVVDLVGDQLILGSFHGFVTGDQVVYGNGGGTDIGGLTDGQTYFVIVIDDAEGIIQLSSTLVPLVPIDLTTVSSGAGHTLTSGWTLYAIISKGSETGLAEVNLADTGTSSAARSILDFNDDPINNITGIEFTDASPTGSLTGADSQFFAITSAARQ